MYPIRPLAGAAGSGMASFWAMLQGGSGPSGSVMNAGFPLSQSNIWMLLGVLALTFVAKALVTLMTIRSVRRAVCCSPASH
mgnify:CR=1 FL=1